MSESIKVRAQRQAHCKDCSLSGLCLPLSLNMSREIRDDQQMMLLLSKKTADERIATFLINLSARFSARGFSANQFRLPMSRNEIGNYLGLAVETVSRVFTRFQQNGLLEAEGKEVRILDSIGLCALAGGAMDA